MTNFDVNAYLSSARRKEEEEAPKSESVLTSYMAEALGKKPQERVSVNPSAVIPPFTEAMQALVPPSADTTTMASGQDPNAYPDRFQHGHTAAERPGFKVEKVKMGNGETVTDWVYTGGVGTKAMNPVTGSSVKKEAPGKKLQDSTFKTMFEASFVDNPKTKQRIYATARFNNEPVDKAVQRYGQNENGDIVYRDDDGVLKYESPDTFLKQVKKGAAEAGASAPAMFGSVVGAALGPVGAMAGAGVGEAVRKLTGYLVYDEPADAADIAIDVVTEAALGGIGAGGGSVFNKSVNATLATGKKEGRILAKELGKGLKYATKKEWAAIRKNSSIPEMLVNPLKDPEEVARLTALGEKFDIPLNIAEVADSPELISKLKLLGDLSQSQDLINAMKRKSNIKIQNAIPKFLDTLGQERDRFEVGTNLKTAIQGGIEGLKSTRREAAKPFYDKAWELSEGKKVDTAPAIEIIDEILAKSASKGSSPRFFRHLRDIITDADGNLQVLNEIKKDDIDTAFKKFQASPTAKYRAEKVKKALVSQMIKLSPDYGEALIIHALHSPPIDRVRNSALGVIAEMEKDNLAGASTQIMASQSAKLIRDAKRLISTQNPQAWDDGVRDYLFYNFNRIEEVKASDLTNIGDAFHKLVFGSRAKKDKLKAAMRPRDFMALSDLMTVLKRTGLTFGRESTTALRQEQIKDMQREFGFEIATIMTSPFRTVERTTVDRLNERLFGKGARRLAEIITDPEAAKQLRNMKQLTPKSEQLTRQLGALLSLQIGDSNEKDAIQRLQRQRQQQIQQPQNF